jgi:hypothetical protein
MAQHVVSVLEFDAEHGVGERLSDCAFQHNRIFFMLWQNMPFRLVSALGTGISRTADNPAGWEAAPSNWLTSAPRQPKRQGCSGRPTFYASGA